MGDNKKSANLSDIDGIAEMALKGVLDDYFKIHKDIVSSSAFLKMKGKYLSLIRSYNERGVRVSRIFERHSTYNELIFDELCRCFEGDEFKDFLKNSPIQLDIFEIMYTDIGNELKGQDYKSKDIDELNVLHNMHMLNELGYFFVLGGKIYRTPLVVDPTNVKDVKSMKADSVYGFYEGVVTKDGKLYKSKNEHEFLVNMLLLLGVDISGAVRITQAPFGGDDSISLSSLYHFERWCSDVKNDKFIRLTDKQADTIVKLLRTLKKGRLCKANNNLDVVIERSSNLGYSFMDWVASLSKGEHFNLPVSKWNFEMFEWASGGEVDAKELQKRAFELSRRVREDGDMAFGESSWNSALKALVQKAAKEDENEA